ncbi:unnamed protein product [Urochloa decumbens]|uniref:PGG domain-containing protein n=1 Tax=Urochloa decumbens TaxID=240449 RepID=A0ABC9E1X0_9POAL
MLPELLMAARSGNIKLLGDLLNGEDDDAAAQAGPVVVEVLEGSLPIRRSPTLPAVVSAALAGVTSRGDSVLHVVAASGDGHEFLQCAELICNKANNLLHDSCNKNGDTPLHCAARVGNVNKDGETVLHEAVRLAMDNGGLVKLLMSADPELARVPEIGTSPLYLAVSLGRDGTALLLHDIDGGLSYSGPDGQSALHAAVLKGKGAYPSGRFRKCGQSCWDSLWNAQLWIRRLLASTTNGCNSGRQDRFQEAHVPKLDYTEESRKMTDSTQYLGISSVLIVTITFAAAFAPPGGYIQDDHPAGAATLAGSYAFDAFVISNTMAYICSSLATFGLMYSGMTAIDFGIRAWYFTGSLILLRSSVRSLGAAFALGIYVALAPVARTTAVKVCVTPYLLPVPNVGNSIILAYASAIENRGFIHV